MANAQQKCDNLRRQLTNRAQRGAPAIGANAWRKKNLALLQDARHWCAIAQQEDADVLADLVPDPLVVDPATLTAGGGAAGGAASVGLTDAEIRRYGAMGLTAVVGVVTLAWLASR